MDVYEALDKQIRCHPLELLSNISTYLKAYLSCVHREPIIFDKYREPINQN